jgi:nucleoside-diphosphate-sugar epimerase
MNILLTGASGFIGQHIYKYLNTKSMTVYPLFGKSDGDLNEKNLFKKYEKKKIDLCIHAAAKVGIKESWQQPKEFFETNTMGTLAVLEFCKLKKIPLIFLSTSVYKNEKEKVSEDEPLATPNVYTLSKYFAEELCKFYSDKYQIKTVILRLFNVSGLGQSTNFLIPYVLEQALKNNEIQVRTLVPRRDFIYIEDVLELIYLTTLKINSFKSTNTTFNAGTGIATSVSDVIKIIQGILGVDLSIKETETSSSNLVLEVSANIDKVEKELGWSPKFSLEEGLKDLITLKTTSL